MWKTFTTAHDLPKGLVISRCQGENRSNSQSPSVQSDDLGIYSQCPTNYVGEDWDSHLLNSVNNSRWWYTCGRGLVGRGKTRQCVRSCCRRLCICLAPETETYFSQISSFRYGHRTYALVNKEVRAPVWGQRLLQAHASQNPFVMFSQR